MLAYSHYVGSAYQLDVVPAPSVATSAQIDFVDGFLPLALASKIKLVYVSGGALELADYDGKTWGKAAALDTGVEPFDLSFDAVADAPATSAAWAIVYLKNNAVWFAHQCQ